MYVTIFIYIQISVSQPIWERAADSVYHMFLLFTGVTSYCDFCPLLCYWQGLESDCICSSLLLFLTLIVLYENSKCVTLTSGSYPGVGMALSRF